MTGRRLSDASRVAWTAIACVALVATAQVARVGIFPTADGISYLDLSDAALAGRWSDFVNSYWSPLFPALLAVGRALVGASSDREVSAVALVNAVTVLLSTGCFLAILRTLSRLGVLRSSGKQAIAEHIVCWSVFAAAVLRIVPISLTTPDLLVVAAQLAALAALLRLREAPHRGRFALAAGAALGAGFLSKGAVLVLSFSYLVALPLLVPRACLRRAGLLMAVGFAVVAAPWIAVLSIHDGQASVGTVARLNLAWYVGRQSSQMPDPNATGADSLPNQWVRSSGVPAIYDFRNHAVGTYPPWTDPTWSHAGLVPRPALRFLRQVLKDSAQEVWSLFGVSLLVWLVLGTGLVRATAAVENMRLAAALAVLAGSQVAVYWPVHVEMRFLGIAWLYAWLAVMTVVGESKVRTRPGPMIWVAMFALGTYGVARPAVGSPRELALAVAISTAVVFVFAKGTRWVTVMYAALLTAATGPWGARAIKGIAYGVDPVRRRDEAIVRALHDAGIAAGAAVASVNASAPALWARMGRWQVVAEVASSQAPAFWRLSDEERAPLLVALTPPTVAAVVGVLDEGAPVPAGWIPVPGYAAVILPVSRLVR